MRVLIVEDEVRLAATLQDLLELEGYSADICHDGESGLDNALTGIYDVMILDVMLPKMDGFTVLRQLRAGGCATPVLMLTARSELSDRVQGLDQGADYYLTKPFEPKELLACVRALTRRQPELRQTDLITCGDLTLEKSSFTLSCGERSVRLSRREFDMMELLMLNQKQVITKESLLLKIWGYESDAEDNNVEVYISFLRKKLEHLHSQVRIKTIRMVGYCLEFPKE
ncbi:response regulator transcription factor [uncultured Oscillibacter sp.]|uniref:response regulator transcription factor n=1 Tax=uncultured Oscillibacter sp. TaxID=876091 RepID=UPI0025D4C433|nr:response regulator transcription factor [uncultured Oscillibacter sp.]